MINTDIYNVLHSLLSEINAAVGTRKWLHFNIFKTDFEAKAAQKLLLKIELLNQFNNIF